MKPIVLNTRPAHQARALTQTCEALGYHVFELPLFTIEPLIIPDKTIQSDIAIFVSANAVDHFFKQATVKADQLYAIGSATARALEKLGFNHVKCPAHFSSEGLLDMPALQSVSHQTITIVSGEQSKPLLTDTLKTRGAIVKNIACYRRKPIIYHHEAIRSLLSQSCKIVVTSGESFEALLTVFESCHDWLVSQTICVINGKMKVQAQVVGFKNIIEADNATDEAIVAAMIK
jgi:uroporphyrinogen-III synthase